MDQGKGQANGQQLSAAESAAVQVVSADPSLSSRIVEALAAERFVVSTALAANALLTMETSGTTVLVSACSASSSDLALFTELKAREPDLRIVVISETIDLKGARRAIDKGVDGLVFAGEMESALVPTINAVLANQLSIPRDLRASMRRPSLSFREKQVLSMVVMGFTNGEIADRLYLAESTVKSHLSSAFSKLGVRSRNEAAAMILDPDGSLGTGILAITESEWKRPEL